MIMMAVSILFGILKLVMIILVILACIKYLRK